MGAWAEKDLSPLISQAEAAITKADYQSAADLLSPLKDADLTQLSPFDQGRYLCLQGELVSRLDRQFDKGMALLHQGVGLLEKSAASPQLVDCYLTLDAANSDLDRWHAALDASGRALTLAIELQDSTRQAKATAVRGDSFKYLGLYSDAEALLEKAIGMAQEANALSVELSARSDLVIVRRELGKDYLNLALSNNELAKSSPFVADRAKAAFTLAYAEFGTQNYAGALNALLMVYDELEQKGTLAWQGTAASNLAEIYLVMGDTTKAAFYVDAALAKLADAKLIRHRMAALTVAANLAAKLDDKATQKRQLQAILALWDGSPSTKQDKFVADAYLALAGLSQGAEAQQYWQAYGQLMAERYQRSQQGKQESDRKLARRELVKAQPQSQPESRGWPWYWGLVPLLGFAAWLLRRNPQRLPSLPQLVEKGPDFGLRQHSGLPHAHLAMHQMSTLLGQGLRCQVLYFRPVFASHPFYQGGYRNGSTLQQRLGQALHQLFPQARLIAEPDAFHYLVVLPTLPGGGSEYSFGALRDTLTQCSPDISGLQLTQLAFPCFPQISRVTELQPLCEMLLLGLQWAQHLGETAWVEFKPLPVAAHVVGADNVRQAVLDEIQRGYIKVNAGPDSPLTATADWAYLAQNL
ncbi:hypothetical protein [Gallaecimonas xiamenensis]|uniref:TPR repeat-containing protein n=1 Tax=Gallaecimonas xiamenensis 3-C-1 TaxID=745411 RepID=K2J3M4_9GAMM|nr:hypothetical protein [Gallaecimonas xiamenensis]EKE69492.1 hypothetical protein B3C1_15312 [Gallaecimonas xiamenensis 3-C-1]